MKELAFGIGAVIIAVFIGLGLVFLMLRWLGCGDEEKVKAVTPVSCECSCPKSECTGDRSMVIDGYNVTMTIDGSKWEPPELNPDESGYVVLCRREDPELVDHPDYTMTKLYNYFHQCIDEIAQLRAGYDDDVNPMRTRTVDRRRA